jgi:hypothetical protein
MHPRYRTLDISRLASIANKIDNAGYTPQAVRQFTADYPRELANLRRKARMRPVAVGGSRAVGSKLGYFETTLRDGTIGYFQRRTDDCVQAALATLLQMPIDRVPDLRLDRRTWIDGMHPDELQRAIEPAFAEWTARYGLTIVAHATPPRWAKRWIGLMSAPGVFERHCVVMTRADYLWDVSHLLVPHKDETVAINGYTLHDVSIGVTVERR